MEKLDEPSKFIGFKDRMLVYFVLFISLSFIIVFVDPFSYFNKSFNDVFLRAVPLKVGLVTLVLPPAIFYGLFIMEKNHFTQLIKKDIRRNEMIKRRQKIFFNSRYREKGKSTVWEVTNRSKFDLTNAKVFVERVFEGKVLTQKFQMDMMPTMTRMLVTSNLESLPGAKWRVMVLSEEGYHLDYPERQSSMDFET